MKKRHLHLVVSNNIQYDEKVSLVKFWNIIKDFSNNIFVSKREKIYVLKDFLIKLYRDYELNTGIGDVPYYVKAELKINQIIKENKVDYYFKLSERLRKKQHQM